MHSESLFRSARCSTVSVHEYDRQTVAAECVSQHSRLENGSLPNRMDGGQTKHYFLHHTGQSQSGRAVVVSGVLWVALFFLRLLFFCQAHDDLARPEEGFPVPVHPKVQWRLLASHA